MAGISRRALVTRNNRGIGFEIARQLAGIGDYLVIIGARDLSLAEAAAIRISKGNNAAIPLPLDVTNPASVEKAAKKIETSFLENWMFWLTTRF